MLHTCRRIGGVGGVRGVYVVLHVGLEQRLQKGRLPDTRLVRLYDYMIIYYILYVICYILYIIYII
jgi:hypothetical protein